jgi:hypothetical protein
MTPRAPSHHHEFSREFWYRLSRTGSLRLARGFPRDATVSGGVLMTTRVIAALVLLLPAAGARVPQEAPGGAPRPAQDEMTLRALRSNPEVLRAEAQVREAEAALWDVRLRVIRDLAVARAEMDRLSAAVRKTESDIERMRQLVNTGQAPQEAVIEAEAALAEARARRAQTESQLRYLLGEGAEALPPPGNAPSGLPGAAGPTAPAEPPRQRDEASDEGRPGVPESYRELLEKKVSVNTRLTLKAAVGWLEDQARPLNVQSVLAEPDPETDPAIRGRRHLFSESFDFEGVPLRSVLEAFADAFDVCFLFRDYGIVVTTRDRARAIRAAAIPEETPYRP